MLSQLSGWFSSSRVRVQRSCHRPDRLVVTLGVRRRSRPPRVPAPRARPRLYPLPHGPPLSRSQPVFSAHLLSLSHALAARAPALLACVARLGPVHSRVEAAAPRGAVRPPGARGRGGRRWERRGAGGYRRSAALEAGSSRNASQNEAAASPSCPSASNACASRKHAFPLCGSRCFASCARAWP
jgi:hypothetical protein